MFINDLYNNKKQDVAEANDPNFVGFMNKALGDKVDPKREQPKTGHDWYDNAPTMSMDNMPSYKHAFKFGMSVLQSMDAETKQHFAEADNDELFSYLMKLARKKGFSPKYFVEEDMIEVPDLFSEIFHDPAMQDWEWADLLRSTLKEQGVAEGGIAVVGWPDEGNHTGNNPPVSVGGTVPARPVVKQGSLVKASGLTGVYRVMDIRGDQAKIREEIPNTGQSTYIPMSDLRVWTNKPVKEQGMAEGAEEDMPVHRIGLTVIDPQHPMVSKRREEYQKTVRVPGHDREQAITAAINHLRRRGFKVLDHHYIGLLEDQLDELNKKTVASWIKQQPERIKGDTGLSRTDFKKARRLVDKSIPSAIAKYKDPGYGKQEPRLDEGSLGDEMAALAQKKFPNAYISKNGEEVQKPENWGKKYVPPAAAPVDLEKQQRDLTARYPNIDELVRRAELNRDPDYEMADGQAYYAARDAEQNYQKLKQIQRVIQGLNESLDRSHLP
jgi:hypothetical protein